ncbi:MAG TPA: protein-L-isoaspartate(D-aspartate) O-methyltransferase [Sulfolobales archaeon]|nr:protein-L-isoaspartate(D-aspartate) O-methyltransferase [Sulfolobales archaeon]
MKELIESLIASGYIRSERVAKAFENVPRELFVPRDLVKYAYIDRPLPIGYGQTISAPHMVAIMTEALDPPECSLVLEIGTGSGYQAAILAELVDPQSKGCGHVVSVELIPGLAMFAMENLRRSGHIDRVSIIVGDGSLGTAIEREVYERIIVTAASPRIPEPLISQLKRGGRLVIPVGSPELQILTIVDKREDGKLEITRDIPCVFVPLRGIHGYRDHYNNDS